MPEVERNPIERIIIFENVYFFGPQVTWCARYKRYIISEMLVPSCGSEKSISAAGLTCAAGLRRLRAIIPSPFRAPTSARAICAASERSLDGDRLSRRPEAGGVG